MEDRSHAVWIVAILFLTLSWFTVSLRVYVRVHMLKSFGVDDWCMVATLIIFTIYISCQIGGLIHGTGRHAADLTRENETIALRYWYFCELFYIFTSGTLKVAIGIFLLRVAVKPIHVWIIRFVIICTLLFGTMYFFVALLQCRPIPDFWQINPGAPTCLRPNIMVGATYAAGVLVSISDWTYGILPMFIVWDLKMTRRSKILVAGILAFAAIGSTATVVRIPYAPTLAKTDDFLYATTEIAFWSTVEPGIGISASCIATLRPLLQLLLWKTGLVSTAPSSSALRESRQKNSRSRSLGYWRNQGDQDLERNAVKMKTMISSPKTDDKKSMGKSWGRSRTDSEEEIMGIGVNRQVVVEYQDSKKPSTRPSQNDLSEDFKDSSNGSL